VEREAQAAQLLASPVAGPHFTVQQIAQMWEMHPDTIRTIFSREAGVLRILGRGKRERLSIRIPKVVLERVYRRLQNSGGAR
jgi:hypothetical protein